MTNTATSSPAVLRRRSGTARSLLLPLVVFEVISIFVALIVMLRQAFFTFAGPAQVDYASPTLDNFTILFTDPFYLNVMWNTFVYGIGVTLLCILVAYPLAYVIARYRRAGAIVFNVVLITSFTSASIRALGWLIVLGNNGPVNAVLVQLGIVPDPLKLTGNLFGVILATAQVSAPYLILLLAPAIEQISPSIEEAAYGMGSSRFSMFYKILVPLSAPALIGGSLICFATTVGSFTTPALVGGAQAPILPVLIRAQTSSVLNYPLAASLSLVLIAATSVVVILGIWATRRLGKVVG